MARRGPAGIIGLNEGPWRWSVGVQAGIAMGLPLAIFTLIGLQSVGLMASLGAFTALYCAQLSRRDRLRVLPLVAAGLVLASIVGVVTSGNIWLIVSGLVVVAAAACVLALGFGLGPPGPLMFVLVTGVTGHLAAPVALGGGGVDKLSLTLAVAAGAVIAYLVVIAPLVVPSVRRSEGTSAGLKALFPGIDFDAATAMISARVVIGVASASLISLPLGVHRAYWVVLAAIAVLQVGHSRRLTTIKAIHRVLGTVIGVLGFGLLALGQPSGLWLVLIIAVLQFATEVVVARNYGIALLFITPLALLISTSAHTISPWQIVGERIIDTLLGAMIALVVFWAGEWILSRRARDRARQ